MNKTGLMASANTIRALAMDAVEKAQSGHPGLPMGCAEIGSYLFGEVMNHYPADTRWINRDRFVLSAGHGSMLLYALHFLSGYPLTLDDIKNFRQIHSKTPGHPEMDRTEGVETSTGPLGQGISNAVGMAIAGKRHAQKFNSETFPIFDSRIFVLAGDGDMMEGISYEACSLAGHLKLNNLIVIYDSNKISIEGSTDIAFTENVGKRFEAMHWDVIKINGHDFDEIEKGFEEAEKIRHKHRKPVLIIADTIIGKGAPKKQATSSCHGAPLGKDEIKACKDELKISGDFFVDPQAVSYFKKSSEKNKKTYEEWNKKFQKWRSQNPSLAQTYDETFSLEIKAEHFNKAAVYKTGDQVATRNAANKILNDIIAELDFVISGSADLGSSTMTQVKNTGDIKPDHFTAHHLQYGVREHAMGGIANGLFLFGGIRPVIGTFLSFLNYMKPAIRMAALMELPIIYLFSHDSLYVGEDGPSHHPIEHLSEIRLVPNLNLLRPADANETRIAWEIALKSKKTPTVITTTRQKIPVLEELAGINYDIVSKGGYIAKKESKSKIDLIMIGTGSELSLCLTAAKDLEDKGYSVRVVNMVSTFLFDKQPESYRESVLPADVEKRMAVEAGSTQLWYKYVGFKGKVIGIDRFSLSGKAEDLAKYFGFTRENVVDTAVSLIRSEDKVRV